MSRRKTNLLNVCPICRVYDPSHFVHHKGCPLERKNPTLNRASLILALYRRDGVRITHMKKGSPRRRPPFISTIPV